MRTVDEYLALPYTVRIVRDPDAGGYVASVDELPGCLTQAETLAEAKVMIHDAIRAWIARAFEDGLPVPKPQGTPYITC
jgi:antitoxin HicB